MTTSVETQQAASPPAVMAHEKIPGWKWAIVWTMFLATMLNYMDRQAMGSTSSHIMKEFGLNETGYGEIEGWFGLAFACMQFPAGYLADRYSLRWVYAISLLVWSAAGFMTGMAHTITALLACRVVLGIGESFNWPCAVGVVQRIIPREARSFANGIFHGGASVGAALTPLLAIWLIGAEGEGWRRLFQIVGAAGLLWAVLWFSLVRGDRAREVSQQKAADNGESPNAGPHKPFIHVFGLRTFWVAMVYGLAVNVTWHFYRAWLPRLLERDHGMDPKASLQYVLAGFYVAADLGSLATGWVTRRLVHNGLTVEAARQRAMLGSAALCLLSWPAATSHNLWVAIPLFFIVAAGAMGGFASYFSMQQEISGEHTSRCSGVLGAGAWFALYFMHPRVGAYVDKTGTFVPLLIVIGFVPLAGALVGLWWPAHSEKPAPQTQ